MSCCRFYGRHALRQVHELVDTHGNQCALIFEAHSPCRMEDAGQEPDLERCELNGSLRHEECRAFKTLKEVAASDER